MLADILRRWPGRVTGSPRWLLATGAVRTNPRLAALVAVFAVIGSLMPTAFSLATGLLVGSLPQTVTQGIDSAAGQRVRLAVVLIGALFVLRQMLGPLNQVASDALGRRFMSAVYRRVMRVSLRPPTILHLEDPDLKDKIQQSLNEGWAGPRAATNALVGWASHRLAGLVALAVVALGLWLVGRAAVQGTIGVGALVVFVTAVYQSHARGEVSENELALQYGTVGFKPLAVLETLVETDPRLALPGTRPAAGLPQKSIGFQGVAFRYPGRDEDVFRHLTLDVPVGRSLAIVGANGAGKTTLIKLLARLYDPTAGRILVDGTDLRELDARSWQRRVAAIFQDFMQYQLPAYDNVALGAVEQQDDRKGVVEAARRAGALELIEGFPRGWDTILSRQYTGGIDVSGGQWQRIALARALFAAAAGAPILIMDEPTAHLDVRAEAAFYDAFLDLTHGLTTIVISHRFSTVRRADQIVVLHRGGVLEQGTHDELMQRRGRYAEMFTLQAQRFMDEVTV